MKVFPSGNSLSDAPSSLGLKGILGKTGRFPPVEISIIPLEALTPGATTSQILASKVSIDRFTSYRFQNSIIVPVDMFTFSFADLDEESVPTSVITEGSIIILSANGVDISTGIIDQTILETSADGGEQMTIAGRNLLGQLQDQNAVNPDGTPFHGDNVSLQAALKAITQITRIRPDKIQFQGISGSFKQPFATEAGETKLTAIQRLLEPKNCIIWMRGDGTLICGKPNMSQDSNGVLFIDRENRNSNVLSMKVIRSSTQIPNKIAAIWSTIEAFQADAKTSVKVIENKAEGPARLLKHGHVTPHAVVSSIASGNSSADLTAKNILIQNSGNFVTNMAQREIARMNVQEIIVEVEVAGHYDADGNPFEIDSVYDIIFDRAGVDQKMYLYELDFQLDDHGGQRTFMKFCNLGTIVAQNASTKETPK